MNIGFDAKRAFHNTTGLGNYSRTLLTGLAAYFPEHRYFLFNPRASRNVFHPLPQHMVEVGPTGFLSRRFPSAWRSSWVKGDLKRLKIELYHGLSHEIPFGIEKTGTKPVVTIHDLIFERYPHQFKALDRSVYRKKIKYACKHAIRIIAISNQTKQDLVDLYGVAPGKIDVCYQACDPVFALPAPAEEMASLRKHLQLPDAFFLYVGSVIERKNLLTICKALKQLEGDLDIPLVVIGKGKAYRQTVVSYLQQHNLAAKVIFLSDHPAFSRQVQTTENIAMIYQMAVALIYPSLYEGFGIPLLEGMWSRVPVITSLASCMPEIAGDAALYINPLNVEELAEAMKKVYLNEELRLALTEKGLLQAQKFTLEKCTRSLMEVYKNVSS
jgi:glycosyltransferase involved in cell wall biosynthesis